MHAVYIHCFKEKTDRIIQCFSNRQEAHEGLENFVNDYIREKEGDKPEHLILHKEPSSINSRRWNTMPFGYIKTRNTKESLFRITIWKKTINRGYFYNSYTVEKIIAVDLISESKLIYVELPCVEDEIMEINEMIAHNEMRRYYSSNVLGELLNKK